MNTKSEVCTNKPERVCGTGSTFREGGIRKRREKVEKKKPSGEKTGMEGAWREVMLRP